MVPSEIRLAKDKKALIVIWSDGVVENFSAHLLRSGSQSAVSKRQDIEGTRKSNDQSVFITEVHPIGSYAVNIIFSDGYDRGIFPWKFLKTLNQRASAPERHQPTDEQNTQNAQIQTMEV